MKIALVLYQYSDSRGGVERYVSDLSKGLLANGHEVHIFAHQVDEVPQGLSKNRLIFHPVPVFLRGYTPFRLISFAQNSSKMLTKERFDIIQGFGRTYYQDVYRFGSGCHWEYLKQTHSSMKYIYGRMLQKLNPRNKIILHLEKKAFRKGHYKKIVCISKRVKQEVQDYYNVPEDDLDVIYNGIDTERFNPRNKNKFRESIRQSLKIKTYEIVILFVGSGFLRKGLRYAIESLVFLPKELPIRLLVMGKGNIKAYQKLATKWRVNDKLIYGGTSSNIEQYYAASDIFLLPTLYEAFGTAYLEAMATGLPALVSQRAGAAEVITNMVDAFVLDDPTNASEIAQKLSLLQDETLRTNMGRAAYFTALKYPFQKNLARTLQIYANIHDV
ncbi:glycosyltransferase family 4 protein [Planctomycetota bacterium]